MDWWDYVSWNPANQEEGPAINECCECCNDYIGFSDFEIPDDEENLGLFDDKDDTEFTVALPLQLPDLDIPF